MSQQYSWTITTPPAASQVAAWELIEDALYAVVQACFQFPTGGVIWAAQSGDRPNTPDRVSLAIDNLRVAAPATPEVRERVNTPSTPGNEITFSYLNQTDFDLVVDVFTMTPHGLGAARSLASKLVGYLSRESVTTDLEAFGLAVVEFGNIQALPTVLETEYQARARVRVRCRVVDGNEETTTFIETANTAVSYS